ncbi:hypothetical protein PA598K_02520 [Paenibacillus sp. 598K]|uniref:PQQ-dependent sugar dehydrogenase n=1 Tax=Paenibacillus sp. 598K TaxID=1117987 RepID=UPI000FFA264D|nr:PQQ-dependent sugar dehydrogenase [Paenibacillus sp. 598K]GBF74188.1 hypothetical protein PA598K_02520 [Paenibacillus sp. 598K]
MKRWKLVLVTAIAIVLTACGTSPAEREIIDPPPPSEASEVNDQETDKSGGYVVLAEGLEAPWSIALAEDVIYISERDGSIVRLIGDTLERQTLQLTVPVHAAGEGGLLGLLLAPDFDANGQAYVYHTYQTDGAIFNRIVAITQTESGWQETDTLLDGIPGGATHNGGRMAWGPDGMLYATTGDAGDTSLAQRLDSLAGKILRMTPEGAAPDDNPFADSYVYSYGHRNPQGIGWSQNGRMYSSEHGPNAHDELNRIEAGTNYGWPEVKGDETAEGMTPPLFHTGADTLAPSGLTVLESGEILLAGLRGEELARFGETGEPFGSLLDGEGRLRDVVAHGTAIYVLTNNTDGRGQPGEADDRLLRLSTP